MQCLRKRKHGADSGHFIFEKTWPICMLFFMFAGERSLVAAHQQLTQIETELLVAFYAGFSLIFNKQFDMIL